MHKSVMVLLSTLSLPAVAAEPVASPPAESQKIVDVPQSSVPEIEAVPAADTDATDMISVLDEPHEYLAQGFADMVNGIDRFFGDNRHYQEANNNVLQLDVTRVSGYGGNNQFTLSGRANVHLPNTEKKLHLLLESDPDKNIGGNSSLLQPANLPTTTTPSSYAAAVRYEKPQEGAWLFSTDAGIKFQGFSSHLFTRARASYSAQSEQWRAKFSETPFWFNNLGVGASSQLDLEHSISAPVLFRASSNATWLYDKQNFDLRQDISVYHTLDERRALLYQASAIGASQPQSHASDYVLLVLYRYRLHQKWMYLEVSPQMHYPQTRNYQPSPALIFRIEMLFDAGVQH